jgi:DNA-binding NarL/FixJ family response regulator
MAIKLVLVEDNAEIRRNLQLILSYYDELAIAAVYSNAEEFIRDFGQLSPDVVIMDINLPGVSGIETVRVLKPRNEKVQYLMCTIYDDEEHIFEALCAGASGYLLKNTAPEKFLQAIKDIYGGGSPMSPEIARKVVRSFQQPVKNNTAYEGLSQREKEILDFLAKGLRYKEIAQELFISIETVRTHIRNIYEKLQVNSRTDALNKIRA